MNLYKAELLNANGVWMACSNQLKNLSKFPDMRQNPIPNDIFRCWKLFHGHSFSPDWASPIFTNHTIGAIDPGCRCHLRSRLRNGYGFILWTIAEGRDPKRVQQRHRHIPHHLGYVKPLLHANSFEKDVKSNYG